MTIHVVCLDGTGQFKNQPFPTNIALMYHALGGAETSEDNGSFERSNPATHVRGKYLPGVGAQGTGRPALRMLGNLFGDGIAEPIIRGYTFLSRVYRPGDAIILTGFSRGATAARALAGWVAARGVLDRNKYDPGNKEQSYQRAIAAWYFHRKGSPDLANQARLRFISTVLGRMPKITAVDFMAVDAIAAVGVFDTVSSLGIPRLDSQGNAVFDFSICDTDLNAKVQNGFHALAADETRDLFAPTFWSDRAAITQLFFPGAHSDVGGGYAEHGLSDAALVWMTEQLNTVRPVFDLAHLPRALAPDALAAAHDESKVFPYFATPSRARAFPHIVRPSDVTHVRLGCEAEILPGAISRVYQPVGRYADGSALIALPTRRGRGGRAPAP